MTEQCLSARHSGWRLLFWFAVAAGVVLALWPQPDPGEPWFAGVDKVEHALSFAVLAWLGLRAGYRRMLALAIGLLILGGAIELAQGLTDTRTADGLDWLADAAGIAVGCLFAAAAVRLRTMPSVGQEQVHRR